MIIGRYFFPLCFVFINFFALKLVGVLLEVSLVRFEAFVGQLMFFEVLPHYFMILFEADYFFEDYNR